MRWALDRLAERVERDGVYTLPLRRRDIRLQRREDIDLLDTVSVADVMSAPYGSLRPDMTVAAARAAAVVGSDAEHPSLAAANEAAA